MLVRFILAEIPEFLGVGRCVYEISQGSDIDGAVLSLAGKYFFDIGHRMTSILYDQAKQYIISHSNRYRLFNFNTSSTPQEPNVYQKNVTYKFI